MDMPMKDKNHKIYLYTYSKLSFIRNKDNFAAVAFYIS
jgi:hypothetical protein